MAQSNDTVVRDGVIRQRIRRCHFCESESIGGGHVDIGGLALCVDCFSTRSARTQLPCEVCGELVPISPNPLTLSQICSKCKANADLSAAWAGSSYGKGNRSCDKCGSNGWRHPTCYGEVVCSECVKSGKGGCIQVYPGDRGYPVFVSEPSIPVVVLPLGKGDCRCCVCSISLVDQCKTVMTMGIDITICPQCEGPKWWDFMKENRKSLETNNLMFASARIQS